MARDDFPKATIETLGKRTGFRCSNPACNRQTCGPADEPEDSVNVGVAAHITAAAPGGPRFDANLTPDERKHIGNGIWLCQVCAKLVDSDVQRFAVAILRQWKDAAERAASQALVQTRVAMAPPAPDYILADPQGLREIISGCAGNSLLKDALLVPTPALDVMKRALVSEGTFVERTVAKRNEGASFARARGVLSESQVKSITSESAFSPHAYVSWRKLGQLGMQPESPYWRSVGGNSPDEPIFNYQMTFFKCGGGDDRWSESAYSPAILGLFLRVPTELASLHSQMYVQAALANEHEVGRWATEPVSAEETIPLPPAASRLRRPLLIPLAATFGLGSFGLGTIESSYDGGDYIENVQRTNDVLARPRTLGPYCRPVAFDGTQGRSSIDQLEERPFAFVSPQFMVGSCPLLFVCVQATWRLHGAVLVGARGPLSASRTTVVLPGSTSQIRIEERDDRRSVITRLDCHTTDGMMLPLLTEERVINLGEYATFATPPNASYLVIEGWFEA
jgi:hypothetical protein